MANMTPAEIQARNAASARAAEMAKTAAATKADAAARRASADAVRDGASADVSRVDARNAVGDAFVIPDTATAKGGKALAPFVVPDDSDRVTRAARSGGDGRDVRDQRDLSRFPPRLPADPGVYDVTRPYGDGDPVSYGDLAARTGAGTIAGPTGRGHVSVGEYADGYDTGSPASMAAASLRTRRNNFARRLRGEKVGEFHLRQKDFNESQAMSPEDLRIKRENDRMSPEKLRLSGKSTAQAMIDEMIGQDYVDAQLKEEADLLAAQPPENRGAFPRPGTRL